MTTLNQRLALVYGSCVSRDLTRIDSERFKTSHYTARQSWISAYSESRAAPEIKLASSFQSRMIENDFKSTGRQIINSSRPTTSDLVLMDLIDERLGVLPYKGSWITYSNELEKTGLVTEEWRKELVPFGTDVHFDLWKAAASQIRMDFDINISKIYVIEAQFAERTYEGASLSNFRGDPASIWNEKFQRYYNELAILGFQLIKQPRKLVVSSEKHLWGATPFHYIDETYTHFGDEIIRSSDS